MRRKATRRARRYGSRSRCSLYAVCGRRRPHLNGLRPLPERGWHAVSPRLGFPPWTPFSEAPPFFKEFRQGGNPSGGQQHGLLYVEKVGRPTGARHHSAAQPPLRHGPQGPGALVGPPPAQPVQGFDTVSAFRGTAAVKPGLRLQVFAVIPASPLALLVCGRVSLPPKTSAPSHRRSSSGKPRTRFPAPQAEPHPFPDSRHENMRGSFRAGPRTRFARARNLDVRDVDTAAAPGRIRPKGWKPGFAAENVENDALRSPRTGERDAPLVLTWGKIRTGGLFASKVWKSTRWRSAVARRACLRQHSRAAVAA